MHGNMDDSYNKMLNEKNTLQKKLCKNNVLMWGLKT